MNKTVVVLNAGIGDLSLGLSMAGFDVVAAFEQDEKAVNIHKINFSIPILQCGISDIEIDLLPKMDLLVARLFAARPVRSKAHEYPLERDIETIRNILFIRRPQAFLIFAAQQKPLLERLRIFESDGYTIEWHLVDVGKMTGMPVREKTLCITGFLREINHPSFPDYTTPVIKYLEEYLQISEPVDARYLINKDVPVYDDRTPGVYCWHKSAYERTETVQWNHIKIPLVLGYYGFRSITHHEIAALKGFPPEYRIPAEKNRQWLYRKLMYSVNINLVRVIADTIRQMSESNPWRTRRVVRGQLFEDIFYSYLEKVKQTASSDFQIFREKTIDDYRADFVVTDNDREYIFELKWYNQKVISSAAVSSFCKKLMPYATNGTLILVICSVVSDVLKEECERKFGITIWDVSNLLWLLDELPEVKNELVATLEYSIDDIEPKQPNRLLFLKGEETTGEKDTWEGKLKTIQPGVDDSGRYEEVCTDILKYVLGDYLTLWKKQATSNDGLYRFDLYCKIKSGVNQDFFETIKHYFNTKYIVFEFKNYSKKITQKEIYTTEKYLYEKALRKVAVVVSRYGADDNAMKAVKGCLRETGKLIICLSDSSLLDMITIKEQGEREPAEFLDTVLDDMLVDLEK